MSLKTEIKTEFNNKDWDNLLLKVPTSTAFQMSYNYDPYKMAFGSIPLYITVEDSTGKILGQLLAVQHFQNFTRESDTIIQSLASKLKIGSIMNWHYGPIIHDDEKSEEIVKNILKKLDKYCSENKILLVNGSLPVDSKIENQNHFSKYLYQNTQWDTWITSLEPELDTIYNSLHNKTRYDVRKGEKSNLIFEIAADRSVLDEWLEAKFAENKNKTELIKKYEKFYDFTWDILYKHNFEKTYVARLDGKLISGISNKLFNQNAVQHAVVNSTKKIQGGSFLTWNTIKWSKENNYLTYDVGGANPLPISSKEKGIRHFKSKWSGEKYDFSLVAKSYNKNRLKLFRTLNSPNLIRTKISSLFK